MKTRLNKNSSNRKLVQVKTRQFENINTRGNSLKLSLFKGNIANIMGNNE